MNLIEEKGMVKFFEDSNGKLHQQIGDGKVEVVHNGEIRYKHIKKVGDYTIQYNLNGVYGFSVWANDILEDRIWDLKEAIEIAENMDKFN